MLNLIPLYISCDASGLWIFVLALVVKTVLHDLKSTVQTKWTLSLRILFYEKCPCFFCYHD